MAVVTQFVCVETLIRVICFSVFVCGDLDSCDFVFQFFVFGCLDCLICLFSLLCCVFMLLDCVSVLCVLCS